MLRCVMAAPSQSAELCVASLRRPCCVASLQRCRLRPASLFAGCAARRQPALAPAVCPTHSPQPLHCTPCAHSIAWTAIQLLFNNFSITFKEVNLPWLGYLRWFSVVYYAFESLSVIEFANTQVGGLSGQEVAMRADSRGGVCDGLAPWQASAPPHAHWPPPKPRPQTQVGCGASVDPRTLAFVRRLLPNNKLLRMKAASALLSKPDPGCVIDLTPVLRYFDFGRSFMATMVIMCG